MGTWLDEENRLKRQSLERLRKDTVVANSLKTLRENAPILLQNATTREVKKAIAKSLGWTVSKARFTRAERLAEVRIRRRKANPELLHALSCYESLIAQDPTLDVGNRRFELIERMTKQLQRPVDFSLLTQVRAQYRIYLRISDATAKTKWRCEYCGVPWSEDKPWDGSSRFCSHKCSQNVTRLERARGKAYIAA